MKVWILFVWMSSFPHASSYETRTDCERMASVYKRAMCVEVTVPK